MPFALHSVSYAGLWGQHALSLDDTLRRAADLGYDGLLVMAKAPHAAVLDLTPGRCAQLAALAGQLGLALPGLAAYTDFLAESAGPEVPLGEYQLAALDRLCAAAADLGGGLVRVFSGYLRPGADPGAAWRRVVESLRRAADLAAGRGVTLMLQNHHDLAVDTAALARLLAEIDHPHCRAAYDAWSPALRGEDLYQGALRLAPLTLHTTVADYVRQPRWRYRPELVNYERLWPDEVRAVPLGEGLVAYEEFFCGLADGGFEGWVTYEMCSPLRDGGAASVLDQYARSALAALKELCGPAER
jgi:sugar phosphate isomerase/epimerase